MTKNFEKYTEFIEEKFGYELKSKIMEIESKIIEFNDENISEIGHFSQEIRSLLSQLLDYMFVEFVKDGDFDEFKSSTFYEKIEQLFDEKENHYVSNQDIRHILNNLRRKTNILSHHETHHDEIEIKDNITKSTLVELMHSVVLVLQWLSSPKKRTSRVKFDSSVYYETKNENIIYKEIKSNIYDAKEKTIRIEDHQIVNVIYDDTITFNIPLYQRGYAWDKENIDDLFFDIKKRIDDGNYHFFGNITFIRMDNKKNDSIIKIVDGQQRITTTLLIMKAIYDKYQLIYNDENKIDDHLYSFVKKHNDFPIKRIDNKEMMGVLNKIWNNNAAFTSKERESSPFIAWKCINEQLQNVTLKELDDTFSSLKKLTIGVNWIKGFDEFELFESLNSKGKKLEDFDKLKNYVYSLISSDIEKEKEEEIVTHFFNFIESKFEDLPKSKIEKAKQLFIIKYIEFVGNKKANKNRLFPEFKNSFIKDCERKKRSTKNINIDEYKKILFDFSKIINATLITQLDLSKIWTEKILALSPYYNLYKNISKATTYSSILFNYVANEEYFEYDHEYGTLRLIKNTDEFVKILKIIEVWKVRRDVSHNEGNITIGSFMQAFINNLMKKIIDEDKGFYESLKELIESQDGFLIMPSIEQFSSDLEKKQLSNKSVIAAIFGRVIEWHNNEDLDTSQYIHIPIIEPELKDRSDKWEKYVQETTAYPIDTLNKIGNYFYHKTNKEIRKIKENDFDYMLEIIEENNLIINLENDYDFPGIFITSKFKNSGEYDEFVDERSKYFASIAKKIFIY